MKQALIFSRVSIRTVLLSVLLVFGGFSLIASTQHTSDSLRDYRENRILTERSQINARLLKAGQHLAYERDRTAVVLSGAGPISGLDRTFINEQRQLADAALDEVMNAGLANVGILPPELVSTLVEQRLKNRQLRAEVDLDAALSMALRDKNVTIRGFDSSSDFIEIIQRSVERLVGLNRPGDKSTRLSLLAAAVLQQRVTAGREARVIAQAQVEGDQPAALNQLYQMRGREDQLWLEIERLAAATGIDAVLHRVNEIKTQHLVLSRPLQDKALAGLNVRGPIPVSPDNLTSASMPVLDGLSGLMLLAIDHAINTASQGAAEARDRLIADIAWSVFILVSLMFALRYVLRYVIAPMERFDKEMEISLFNTRKMYTEAQRIAHLGSWELNLVDNVLSWSDEIYRIFEINPQQFGASYEAFMIAVHPDDRERIDRIYKTSLENKEPSYEVEHRLLLPDGRIKYVFESCETYYDNDGKPLRSLGTVQDITERKLAEVAFEQARNRLHGVLQTIPDLVWVKDTAGVYLSCNPAFERFFGAKEAEIIGKTDYDFVDVELADFFRQKDREAIEANRICINEEWITFAEDQRRALVEVRKVPLRDTHGNVMGVLGISHEITERKRMEEELVVREREFRSLAENMPDNIARWDTDGRYLYINPVQERTLGAAASEIVGTIISDRYNRIKAAIAEVAVTGLPTLVRQTAQVGSEMQIHEISLAPERDGEGRIVSVLGLGRDMTELYRLQGAVATREREYRTLAENMPDNVVRWDVEGRYLYLNPVHERTLGASANEIVGTKIPDSHSHVKAAIAEVAATGQAVVVRQPILVDGDVRIHEVSLTSECDATGRIISVLCIGRDLTDYYRLQEALAAREQEFRNLAESSPDFIIRYDAEHRMRYLNANLLRYLGLASAAEVIGKRPIEVWPDGRFAVIDEAAARAIQSGSMIEVELVVPAENGELSFNLIYVVPERDVSGQIVGTIAFGRDVSGLKRMEIELREQKDFQQILLNALQGVGIQLMLVENGRIKYALNRKIFNESGYTDEEIDAGLSLFDIIYPDDCARVMDLYARCLSGEAVSNDYELGLVTRFGERREFEMFVSIVPGTDPVRIITVGRDITERKRMEAALQESEARYRQNARLLQSMLESTTDVVVYALDRDCRYISFNLTHSKSFKRLWGKDIAVGMSIFDVIVDEEFRLFCRHGFDHVFAGNSFAVESVENVVVDGRLTQEYWENYGSPIRNDEGCVIGLTVFATDVTVRKMTEKKLKAALEFNEGIISAIPDLLFEMDKNGRYLNLWTRTPELLAAQKEALLGNSVHQVLDPESAAVVMESLHEAEENGVSFGKVIRIELPRGENWFELSVSKKPSDGVFLVLSRDITERRRMESALSESKARYRYHFNLLQSMMEGSSIVSVFALDREYRYLSFNKRHREGAKRLRGTDIAIGMNMVESIEDEEFREFCRRGFDHVLTGANFFVESKEVLVENGCTSYEYNDNYGSPIFNDSGVVVGLTVFAINTTERKRLEAELRASHNFLDTVIDSVSDPIFVKDRQHRWTLLNDAFCTFIGYSRETLLGKSDYDFFPEEQADEFWAKDEQVFNAGEINLNEEIFTTATGEEHYIQTKKTPFIAADGQQMLAGVIRDITDLKRYQLAREAALTEAIRLAKTRSEFLAHMSHELRTPLNAILGYTQILQRDKAPVERSADALNVIQQSGEHLLALVEDILDLARIEAGRFKLDLSDIFLNTFLGVVTGIVRIKATQKGLEFKTVLAADLPLGIVGDDKRLRQVLLNLLSNAIKFTEHGQVVLHVSRASPQCLVFMVEDTGSGIAENELETIFQPFEQSSDVQQRLGGTGLGLAISQELVRLMGGDIVVKSRLGEGSVFSFELELPEVEVEPVAWLAASVDQGGDEPAESLILPPVEEMQLLHKLAQLGNMRDIVRYAERIQGLAPSYQPFAARLRSMAENYQSKAILAFVEGNLHEAKN